MAKQFSLNVFTNLKRFDMVRRSKYTIKLNNYI